MRGRQLRQGILLGVLAVTSLWLVSLIWGLAGKARVAVGEEQAAKREYEALEARKNTLAANLNELATPRGKEAAIRTAFGVAKAGEEVIVVVPPSPATTTPPKSFWQRVWDWF
jgi:cell division protein FtsB